MNKNENNGSSANFDRYDEPWRYLDEGQNNYAGFSNPDYAPSGLIDLVDSTPNLILDIGCSIGAVGGYMKKKWPHCRVVGVEPVSETAAQANLRLDDVYEGFFENMPNSFGGIEFGNVDLAVFADVLEHMYNPWKALQHVHKWLSPQGFVLVSLPNIRNLNVLKNLAGEGSFNYKPSGILDITHVRFFTRQDAIKMFEQTGFKVEKMGNHIDHSLENLIQQMSKDTQVNLNIGNRVTLNKVNYIELEELCTLQFYFLLRVTGN
jgi:SAM-dependent methyltransferase